MFQSGYLTIKGYMNGLYFLGFPNHEVRQALYEMGTRGLESGDRIS